MPVVVVKVVGQYCVLCNCKNENINLLSTGLLSAFCCLTIIALTVFETKPELGWVVCMFLIV